MHSISDINGKGRQPVQSYQPVWMAHWMPASSKASAERCAESACGNKKIDRVFRDANMTNELEASKAFGELEMIETETECLRMSSKSSGYERMHSTLMKRGKDADEMQAIRPSFDRNLEHGKASDYKGGIQFSSVVPAADETSFRKYHSTSEEASKNLIDWVKTHVSAKDRSCATSTPFQERFDGSSMMIKPYQHLEKYEYDKGKAVICPSVSRTSIVSDNQIPNTKLPLLEQEHCRKHNQSACLVCERKMDSHSESDTFMNVCFRECSTPLLLDAPSVKDHHLPKSGQDWFQKMQNCSDILLPLNQHIASDENKSKISHYDNCSLHKFPNCVCDMETMRICTTVDSVEAMPGGHPRFSKTTHNLLITKKTDVNVSIENDIFRRLITTVNGNSPRDLHNVLPFFGQASRGVKLQPLSSSSNSERQENIKHLGTGTSQIAIKSEKSAGKDTMGIDFLKDERPNSSANSTHSTKGFNFDMNLSPEVDIASSRKDERQLMSAGLPDISLELPSLPPAACSSENACPSSARTQSLEVDVLLAHAEQPIPKSNYLDDSSKADPTTRWVKRLKLSSSDCSAQGKKSLNLIESSSHDKKREFFRSIFNSSITSSEPTPRNHHGKETGLSNGSQDLSKEDEHFMHDSAKKKCKELFLSHSWIKRWLHSGSQISEKKSATSEVCEPQSWKSSLDDLQKKQSIAAMALMGKAMGRFQSCELQKRGAFTFWNTKAF